MEVDLVNEKYTAQAATQEEAIAKGLDALGISKEEAIITVDEPGKKGFLGLGQKDAIVTVERKEKTNLVDEFLSNEFEEKTKPAAEAKAKDETLEEARDQSEAEEDSKELKAKDEEAEMDTEEFVEGRNPADVEIVKEDTITQTATEEETDSSKPAEAKEINDDQEAIEAVRTYLKEIILTMGVEDVEVYTSRVKNNVKYDIETENAGLVIGRHGKVLNGLQTLAQNHMHQLAYSKINVRVDAEKYRERRRNTVESLAERTADKVIKTNRAVKLDPMPAHERKQIHRYLNRNPKVKTHSEGREPKRYLVVAPEE